MSNAEIDLNQVADDLEWLYAQKFAGKDHGRFKIYKPDLARIIPCVNVTPHIPRLIEIMTERGFTVLPFFDEDGDEHLAINETKILFNQRLVPQRLILECLANRPETTKHLGDSNEIKKNI